MSWWNPVSWWDDARRDLGRPIDVVEHWVLKQIAKAADLLESDIRDAEDFASSLWHDARREISHAVSDLSHDIPMVAGWVERGILDAERHGLHWLDDARHEAAHLFDDARHDTAHALDDVRHDAARWADDARHDARVELDRLRHDTAHALDDVRHTLYSIDRFIARDALDAVHLVDKCWKFLEWIAEHPLAALETLPHLLEEPVSFSEIATPVAAAKSIFDQVEAELSDVVGDL